jgi:hypothetical protein
LNPLHINEDVTQEILRSLRDQQNLDGPTLKIFKDHNTLLIIACKKMRVERKLNKKCKRSSIDCSFALAFVFFQFVKSSNKIETMKMEKCWIRNILQIQLQMATILQMC